MLDMQGHVDTVTGLKLSPDGNHVLSNAMDNTVRMWDVRPYAKERMEKVFKGCDLKSVPPLVIPPSHVFRYSQGHSMDLKRI